MPTLLRYQIELVFDALPDFRRFTAKIFHIIPYYSFSQVQYPNNRAQVENLRKNRH